MINKMINRIKISLVNEIFVWTLEEEKKGNFKSTSEEDFYWIIEKEKVEMRGKAKGNCDVPLGGKMKCRLWGFENELDESRTNEKKNMD